ncbi:interferon-induced protein 44-like isoform X1 [Lates japonicus]|uniref:Interferon-induced protein 44-like isoform X1 n=1 Tax=Lates japonicus TaxID=270547 RepID=A0AAD3M9T1_LATJO|nr:interferon-induced protein 44-like isoform X1 [Lates japonicus]
MQKQTGLKNSVGGFKFDPVQPLTALATSDQPASSTAVDAKKVFVIGTSTISPTDITNKPLYTRLGDYKRVRVQRKDMDSKSAFSFTFGVPATTVQTANATALSTRDGLSAVSSTEPRTDKPFPFPGPKLESQWRDVEWTEEQKTSLMTSVSSYKPSCEEVTEARVLLLGPVGSGKSSFISSVQSVFNGRVTNRAMVGSSSTSFTKKVMYLRTSSVQTSREIRVWAMKRPSLKDKIHCVPLVDVKTWTHPKGSRAPPSNSSEQYQTWV